MNLRFSQLISTILVLALFLRAHPAQAEAAAPAAATPTAEGATNDGFVMPEAPEPVQPYKAPKPQSRSSDDKAAATMAMVGAAMAGAQCAKLMNEARKAKAEGDTKSAQMYQMMAMQQCQQAAKDAADAAKNNKSKDDAQENNTPQLAKLPAQKAQKLPGPPSDKIDQAGLGATPPSDDAPSPDPEVVELVTRDTDLSSPSVAIPPSYARPGDDFIIPDLIDKAKITGNESAGAVGAPGGNVSPTNSGNSFAASMKAGSDLKGTNPGETPMTQANTRGISGKGGGGGEGGDPSTPGRAAENGEGGGGMNLNDMMAGLFGGGAPGAAAGGFMGAQGFIDYTPTPTSHSTGKRMNIFEAASYLFQQSSGTKVKKAKVARHSTPHRTQVAELSK